MLPLGAAERLRDFLTDGPAARQQRPATPTSRLCSWYMFPKRSRFSRAARGLAMPTLQNPRHEAFAQELAKDSTADRPMKSRATKRDPGHASRLAANGNVCNRVAELQAAGAERAVVTVERLICGSKFAWRRWRMDNSAPRLQLSPPRRSWPGYGSRSAKTSTRSFPISLLTPWLTELIDRPPRETYEECDARRTRLANRRTDQAA